MAKVHNRDHIAVLRGRFTLLPLLPLSRNRSNSSFSLFPGVDSFPQSRANTRGTCLTSLSQKAPLNKPGSPHKPETKETIGSILPGPWQVFGHWNSRSSYQNTPAPAPAPPALQVPWTPKHRTPQLLTPIPFPRCRRLPEELN